MALIPVFWSDPWSFYSGMEQPYVVPRMGWQISNFPKRKKAEKWTEHVKLGDFNPEQVKVKVENDKVIIHAKYTDGNDEWGDLVERKRTVKIPEDVDADQVHSFMRSDGTLILEAQHKKDETNEEQVMKIEKEDGVLLPSGSENNLMQLDIGHYKPEELTVKCKDGVLTAKGSRHQSEGGLEIRESFFRQMALPKDVDMKNIKCTRDANGTLVIHVAHPKKLKEDKNRRVQS